MADHVQSAGGDAPSPSQNMTDKQLILETIRLAKNKGNVNAQQTIWAQLGMKPIVQDRIKDKMLQNKFINMVMGQPYTFELTTLATQIKPSDLDEDGMLKVGWLNRLIDNNPKISALLWTIFIMLLTIFTTIYVERNYEKWFPNNQDNNTESHTETTAKIPEVINTNPIKSDTASSHKNDSTKAGVKDTAK